MAIDSPSRELRRHQEIILVKRKKKSELSLPHRPLVGGGEEVGGDRAAYLSDRKSCQSNGGGVISVERFYCNYKNQGNIT